MGETLVDSFRKVAEAATAVRMTEKLGPVFELCRKEGETRALVWSLQKILESIEHMRDNPYSGSEAFASAKLVQVSEVLKSRQEEIAREAEAIVGDLNKTSEEVRG
jgi:hypothetical protein